MKRKNINNKGITLITLVITIIVIAILASVATYSGIQVIESSKLTRFTAEMKLIQDKVNEIYEDENKRNELQSDAAKIATTNDLETSLSNFNDWGYSQNINSYKKYTKADLKNIGVDDIQQENVLIDFTNRKIISCEGVKADGITYYVLEQLPNNVYNVEYDELSEVQIAKKYGNIFENNKAITDSYKNVVTIPKGFKVSSESADTIDEGIVIEDREGNQFVWIPVGEVYTNKERTNAGTIELKRYDWENNKAPENWTEDTKENHNNSYKNAIAKDIKAFIKSANDNKGYYLGRYEAGVEGYDPENIATSYNSDDVSWTGYVEKTGEKLKLVCKSGAQVWDYVTQNKASELSQNMYENQNYESDLMNGYAWDTAIEFIQTFGKDTNTSKNYASISGVSTTRGLSLTGKGKLSLTNKEDKQCNIYDMSGNAWEWSTETTNNITYPCVHRGGFCKETAAKNYTAIRHYSGASGTSAMGQRIYF